MKSQFSNHPLGRHLVSCTRCIYVNLNLSMLALAAATLYLAVTAYAGSNPELMVYYHYEPINVMVLTGSAIALVLAALIGIYSSIALYFDGLVGNAIILLLLVVGTTGYTIWRGIINDYTRTGELFVQFRDDIHNYPRLREMIDTLQRIMSCCGAEGFTDWKEGSIPSSCCPGVKDNEETCAVTDPLLNRAGCFDRLSEILRYYNWMILIALGLLHSIQTVVVSLSYVLCRAIRSNREEEPPTAPTWEPEHEPELQAEQEPEPAPEPEPEPAPEPEPVPEPAPKPATTPEPQTETVTIPIPPPLPPSKVEEAKCIIILKSGANTTNIKV